MKTRIFAILFLALSLAFCLASCDEIPDNPPADPPHTHTEGGWIIDKEPTCTETGSKHTECTECEETISTETIPATGHTESDWIVDVEPTCTEEGSKHTECAICSETIATASIPMTEHLGETTWVKNSGSHYLVYSCCSLQASDSAEHMMVDGVCTECGFSPAIIVAPVEASPGDTQVEIAISIKDNPGITGLMLVLQYSSDALVLTNASNGEALSALTFTAPNNLNSNCTFLWDGIGIEDSDIKDGELLILTFDILPSAPEGEHSVFLKISAYDNELNRLTLIIEIGKITIKNQ